MSLAPNSLKIDHFLIWQCGLSDPLTSQPDRRKIADFFSVSERSAARWALRGLPGYAKRQLVMIAEGRMLPPQWRGFQVVPDGLMSGAVHIPISHLKHWPHLMHCVDWSRVPVQIVKKGA